MCHLLILSSLSELSTQIALALSIQPSCDFPTQVFHDACGLVTMNRAWRSLWDHCLTMNKQTFIQPILFIWEPSSHRPYSTALPICPPHLLSPPASISHPCSSSWPAGRDVGNTCDKGQGESYDKGSSKLFIKGPSFHSIPHSLGFSSLHFTPGIIFTPPLYGSKIQREFSSLHSH